MKKFLGIALVFLSAAAANAARLPEQVLVTKIEQFENLMPPVSHPVRTTITFEVLSGGCTSEQSFKLNVRKGSGRQILEVVRTQVDPCEMVPFRKEITLETEALTTQPIQIVNPLFADVHTVH